MGSVYYVKLYIPSSILSYRDRPIGRWSKSGFQQQRRLSRVRIWLRVVQLWTRTADRRADNANVYDVLGPVPAVGVSARASCSTQNRTDGNIIFFFLTIIVTSTYLYYCRRRRYAARPCRIKYIVGNLKKIYDHLAGDLQPVVYNSGVHTPRDTCHAPHIYIRIYKHRIYDILKYNIFYFFHHYWTRNSRNTDRQDPPPHQSYSFLAGSRIFDLRAQYNNSYDLFTHITKN